MFAKEEYLVYFCYGSLNIHEKTVSMYLLGYDIGSSSVKAALVDSATGQCVAMDFYPKSEAPIKAVRPGWAEQRPDDWWEYLKCVTHSVLASGRISPGDIGAIGISYQMHGLVAVDSRCEVIRDAIIWCDSRGVPTGKGLLPKWERRNVYSAFSTHRAISRHPSSNGLRKTSLRPMRGFTR